MLLSQTAFQAPVVSTVCNSFIFIFLGCHYKATTCKSKRTSWMSLHCELFANVRANGIGCNSRPIAEVRYAVHTSMRGGDEVAMFDQHCLTSMASGCCGQHPEIGHRCMGLSCSNAAMVCLYMKAVVQRAQQIYMWQRVATATSQTPMYSISTV